LSQKYVPSINYGSRVKNVLRKPELAKHIGKDIIVHYKGNRVERLKVHAVEGPYVFVIAPKSSLGHVALEITKWDFKEENGVLNAYPKSLDGLKPESKS
jgi:hypothetical protein